MMEALTALSRTIEVMVVSGEDLPARKKAVVTVRTECGDVKNTGMEKHSGRGYAEWNEKLTVNLPMHARYLTVELHCNTSIGGNKFIGAARIPTSDFFNGTLPEDYLHFLSYRLRDSHGLKSGIINITIQARKTW